MRDWNSEESRFQDFTVSRFRRFRRFQIFEAFTVLKTCEPLPCSEPLVAEYILREQ
jgi:hypothetical protein